MTDTALQEHPGRRSATPAWLIGGGAGTLLAVVLSFLAFHDVHAGEADLTTEYSILIASAVWILFMAVKLVREGRRVVGLVSLIALATVIWLARDAGPSAPVSVVRDLIATAVFFWFIALSGILMRTGFVVFRESEHHSTK